MVSDALDLFHRSPSDPLEHDGPVLVAIGNCQAESLRVVMPDAVATVRTPPVHELTPDDAAQLVAWLGRADLVVIQPIHDGYRGLPVGTRELLAATPSRARVAVVPVIRFAGLYPRHLIIRPPSDTSLTPPLVAYHDAAVLAEAAGSPLPPLTSRAVKAVAHGSTEQLRAREERHGTLHVSDLFSAPRFELMRTINHPGNPVWSALGQRVLDALGIDAAVREPQRPLLDSVHAPREQVVIDAYGLESVAVDHWIVDGRALAVDEVRRAHLAWYAEHPDAVEAGVIRHGQTLRELAGA